MTRQPSKMRTPDDAAELGDAEPPPVDLRSLDPSRDELRWERLVQAVSAQAVANRADALTVAEQLRRWARPTLAVALGAAAASWLLAVMQPTPVDPSVTDATEEPTEALARWATTGELPSTTNIIEILGGPHGAQ